MEEVPDTESDGEGDEGGAADKRDEVGSYCAQAQYEDSYQEPPAEALLCGGLPTTWFDCGFDGGELAVWAPHDQPGDEVGEHTTAEERGQEKIDPDECDVYLVAGGDAFADTGDFRVTVGAFREAQWALRPHLFKAWGKLFCPWLCRGHAFIVAAQAS